LLLIVFK